MGRFSLAAHIQAVQPPAPRDIEAITGEILEAKRTGGEAILTIGRGLLEAKAQLSHGEWLPWLEERVDFSESTAQKFMRLAQKYTNPATLTDLGKSKALILLALPDETRDEYIEASHIVNGEEKTVFEMSARELKAALKERDEALRAAAQAKADQNAAEQAREKMVRDMAAANARIEGLNAEVEELRARPVDVAVEADPAAIEAARKEATAAMQAQLNKVRKERERAYDACKAAEEAMIAVQQELVCAQAEVQASREQAARAEKRASLTVSGELALFQAPFDQVQEQLNKLGGVLMKVRLKDPERAEGLARAMAALSEKIKGAAQG